MLAVKANIVRPSRIEYFKLPFNHHDIFVAAIPIK